jgi:hypothetical protein
MRLHEYGERLGGTSPTPSRASRLLSMTVRARDGVAIPLLSLFPMRHRAPRVPMHVCRAWDAIVLFSELLIDSRRQRRKFKASLDRGSFRVCSLIIAIEQVVQRRIASLMS